MNLSKRGIHAKYHLIVGYPTILRVLEGAGLFVLSLNSRFLPIEIGWRLVFGLGALLGLVILLVRHDVPESPRWLLVHGYLREANVTMAAIEAGVHGASIPASELVTKGT